MKAISQDTFDQVVLENIIEFQNTLEEAIEEATKEFETQGVQLGNIVKNPSLSEDESKLIHKVVESLALLKRSIEEANSSKDGIISNLKIFAQECKISLAHRMLASKNNAYEILIPIIKYAKDNNDSDILNYALVAICSLSDTNPDILTKEGIDLLIDLLRIWQANFENEDVPYGLANWSLECCLKHEGNRQAMFEEGVPRELKSLLLSHRRNKNITRMSCKALRAFTLDDDIRMEFGKAHEHARLLVEELDMIKLCLECVKEFLNDSDVTSEFLSTISRLCVRAEYCQQAVDNGALVIINDILISFPDNAQLNKQSINLLKTICGNDKVKEDAMKSGVGYLIVSALKTHQMVVSVCDAGCGAISMLSLRTPSHAQQLVQVGAADAVVHAMKLHPKEKQVQKMGCMAVRNLGCRVPENKQALIECGVESVIHLALDNFGKDYSMMDLAKAALRDLDLKVNLEEQWRGTGIEIER